MSQPGAEDAADTRMAFSAAGRRVRAISLKYSGARALPNKRMHQTWRGHGPAPGRHLAQLDRQFTVTSRATQVMRGR
jgi:hypothetical protein